MSDKNEGYGRFIHNFCLCIKPKLTHFPLKMCLFRFRPKLYILT